jgi:hypothetical protein
LVKNFNYSFRSVGELSADRTSIPLVLCVALRRTPLGILGDLGNRWLPDVGLSEKIVAEAILEHLQLSGWRLTHHPKPTVTPAP